MTWGHYILDEFFDDDMNVTFETMNVSLDPVVVNGNDAITCTYYLRGRNISSGKKWIEVGSMHDDGTIQDNGTMHYMYGNVIDIGNTFCFNFLSEGKVSYITYSREVGSISVGWDTDTRIGPKVLQFSSINPFDDRAVLFGYNKTIWKPKYDKRFDFFGREFFINDIDKMRYMTMMQNRDFSFEDML